MKTMKLTLLAAAVAFAFGASAATHGMTKDEYKSAGTSIEADYKSAKTACEPLKANARDVCMAQAKGQEKIAHAALQATYEPSDKTRYDARVAKADAEFAVAKEKCDDQAGNAKDVCRKEAEAAHVAAKADAKTHMKTAEANKTAAETTSDANKVAGEKSVTARSKADSTIVDARKDAATDKRAADYALAVEKCDALASATKDACVADAKARFGKS
jgi:hypothetical protein